MIFPSSRETNLFCKVTVVPLLLFIGDKVPVKLLKFVVFVGSALRGRVSGLGFRV
jgi:hypothetical protein